MELLTTTNLLTLFLLLIAVPKIWKCCWILVWQPLMLSRKFKKQGISGPNYKLLYGNNKEIKKMKIQASSSVLDPNTNDTFPRVFPHLHQWISQYGETFLYWNGTEPTLCVSDPELAKQILSSKLGFSVVPKRRPEVLILFGKGLTFTEGDDWIRHRRVLNPAFSIDRIKVMTKLMVDCTFRMFEEWRKKITDIEPGEKAAKMEDMSEEFHRLTADVIATSAFGSSYLEGIEIFRAQIELRNSCVASATKMFIPGAQYLPTPLNLQIWKRDRKVKSMIKRIIDARLKSQNYGDDLLGIMLNASMSNDPEKKMSSEEIIEEIDTLHRVYFRKRNQGIEPEQRERVPENLNFNVAGDSGSVVEEEESKQIVVGPGEEDKKSNGPRHGTTSIFMTWTTMLLSLHQDWQEKLRDEVFKECGKDKIPNPDTFSKLKLMNMVLLESLRLYGPIIKMFRQATQDVKIGHVEIPKGMSIILPIIKMHTDKAVWGDDADKFNPLRFENGVSQAANNPNALLAFSTGPRTCIGQNFAMMEAKTVFTMILQRFRFSLSDEYKHAPVDHLDVQPQYGVPVMLHPL